MDRFSSEVLESYLRAYGWTFRSSGNGQWLTGWQGECRSYPLRLTLCETWLAFQVSPFLKLDIDWEAWPEVSRFLLELNQNTHMVKLSLDSRGNIHLSLELFTSSLNFDLFSNALGVLDHYAESLYERIQSELDELGFHYMQFTNFLT